jgi:hypothetical protein
MSVPLLSHGALHVCTTGAVYQDGRHPSGPAGHRLSAPDICGCTSVPRSILSKPAVLVCTSAPTRPGRGCQTGRAPASPGRFSDSQPDSNPFTGPLKIKRIGGLFEQPNPTAGLVWTWKTVQKQVVRWKTGPFAHTCTSALGVSVGPPVVGRGWSPVSSNKARGCCCRTTGGH